MRYEASVGGMDCSSCAAKIEHVVSQLDDVDDVIVDVTMGKMRVDLREEGDTDRLRQAVTDLGYSVHDSSPSTGSQTRGTVERRLWHDRRLLAVIVGATATVVATVMHAVLDMTGPGVAVYLVAILLGGVYVFKNAFTSARHRHLDINVLMTIAVVGAMAIGEWFEAATVVVLFAFAEWLEGASMNRARRAIRDLMDLAPPMARVMRRGGEEEVRAEEVSVGELVVVRPGEAIPLDGTVRRGEGDVDQSPITGESIPASKSPGEAVYAGTLNARGNLEIEVTAPASESTIAHVLRAIEQAQANRSESERFIERFARWYTPAVVILAALIAVVPPLLFAADWGTWFYRALVLLVIACPCALVIATPITTVSGLARSARDGILVKGGRFLEHLGDIRAIVFDKTGTLTQGKLAVGEVVGSHYWEASDVLEVAAFAERRSEHYVARAIVVEMEARGITPAALRLQRFEAHAGEGVEAMIELCKKDRGHEGHDGELDTDGCCDHDHDHHHEDSHGSHEHDEAEILVGSRRLLERFDVDFTRLESDWERLEDNGSTVVGVARDGELVGIIECRDQVREGAAETLTRLRESGVRDIRICTGDNEKAARALAREVGVDESAVHANLMPADKVSILEELRSTTDGAVAMVGDGINDAPALAAADVGIAMGAAGTDVALETSHVALMGDRLERLPDAMLLGRRTVSIIRQNVALAIVIKVVILALATGGFASLWMAIAADMGTSLVVIGNGMRLLRVRI